MVSLPLLAYFLHYHIALIHENGVDQLLRFDALPTFISSRLSTDEREGRILFEGDRDRYVIPGDAILGCDVEDFVTGLGLIHHPVVVRARHPEGNLELPFLPVPEHAEGEPSRQQQARAVRDEILRLMQTSVPSS